MARASPPCCAMASSGTSSSRNHGRPAVPVRYCRWLVSIMTGNAKAMAVRPALERRWDDALAAFDVRTGIGVLGVPGRADTVEELSELIRSCGVSHCVVRDGCSSTGSSSVASSWTPAMGAGGSDGRRRARSQPARPRPPAQPRLPSRRTQRSTDGTAPARAETRTYGVCLCRRSGTSRYTSAVAVYDRLALYYDAVAGDALRRPG